MAGSIDSTIDSRNSSRVAHASVAVHDLAIEATQEERPMALAADNPKRHRRVGYVAIGALAQPHTKPRNNLHWEIDPNVQAASGLRSGRSHRLWAASRRPGQNRADLAARWIQDWQGANCGGNRPRQRSRNPAACGTSRSIGCVG